MNKLWLLILFPAMCFAWDYLLFVQYWPGCWIQNDHIKGTNFTNNYFNIHGIWPEYNNGSYPQFCNKTAIFDPGQLTTIRHDLTRFWTNYHNAEKFWYHEFCRHATCAENDVLLRTEFEFFNAGLTLRSKYNLYHYLANSNIHPTNTQKYPLQQIYDTIKSNVGTDVAITCANSILDEIIICLDANLNLINCPSALNTCHSKLVSYNYINN